MFKSILIPTDGSPLSSAAIAKGIELAKALGARVVGLTVTTPYPYSALSEYIPETREAFEQRASEPAARHLGEIATAAAAAGVPCETVMESDEQPHRAIIEVAERKGCDAILMASHGRRGLSGFLLGSETQKVLVHSRLPVIVFR
jgi:nucleotide-binding universal stress UspA family protein